MYAVAFDLTVGDTEKHHPKGDEPFNRALELLKAKNG
jgi:virulence-associated protein VapD